MLNRLIKGHCPVLIRYACSKKTLIAEEENEVDPLLEQINQWPVSSHDKVCSKKTLIAEDENKVDPLCTKINLNGLHDSDNENVNTIDKDQAISILLIKTKLFFLP